MYPDRQAQVHLAPGANRAPACSGGIFPANLVLAHVFSLRQTEHTSFDNYSFFFFINKNNNSGHSYSTFHDVFITSKHKLLCHRQHLAELFFSVWKRLDRCLASGTCRARRRRRRRPRRRRDRRQGRPSGQPLAACLKNSSKILLGFPCLACPCSDF